MTYTYQLIDQTGTLLQQVRTINLGQACHIFDVEILAWFPMPNGGFAHVQSTLANGRKYSLGVYWIATVTD